MENLLSDERIKLRIKQLEEKQHQELKDLKDQLHSTYQEMQPVNLIKSTIHDVVHAPEVQQDLLNAGVSLAAGYLAKKLAFGNSENALKNMLGDLFQVGVTATIAKHPEAVNAIGHKVIEFVTEGLKDKTTVDEAILRKRIMKQIMQITQLIQTAHPQLYKILEETPLHFSPNSNEISIENLRSYRDSLKLQLIQFGKK